MEELRGPQGSDSTSIPEAGPNGVERQVSCRLAPSTAATVRQTNVREYPSSPQAGLRKLSARSKMDTELEEQSDSCPSFTRHTPGGKHGPTVADNGTTE